MMNKEDFFYHLGQTSQKFEPKGIRISSKWEEHKLFICGPASIDPTLVLGIDIWPVDRTVYKSESRALLQLNKLQRWFKEWEGEYK